MRYKIKYLQANQLKETTLKAQSPQEAKDILIAQGYIFLLKFKNSLLLQIFCLFPQKKSLLHFGNSP